MSEKLTTIRLKKELQDPKCSSGSYNRADWGEKTFEEMLGLIKISALHDFEVAKAILEAKPEDFECYVHRGVHIQTKIKDLYPE